jgi:hypothetical protein
MKNPFKLSIKGLVVSIAVVVALIGSITAAIVVRVKELKDDPVSDSDV